MAIASLLRHLSPENTPQTEPVPGKLMVENSAGGFVFAIDDWSRLDRFLVLGSEGGTYYATERKITLENAAAVKRCIAADPKRTVDRIAEISKAGRAPRNDAAIFALAMCASDSKASKFAYEALNSVCRIGTHLFHFVAAVNQMRGWGRGLKRAVAKWYTSKTSASLAYQAIKYQQRDGWSHRDALRLSHPKPEDGSDTAAILHWIVKGWESVGEKPHDRVSLRPIWAFERAKRITDKNEMAKLIVDYDLPRECVPTQLLNEPAVWEALLANMPLGAMVRNLGNMSKHGILSPLSAGERKVVEALGDANAIRNARLHPINLLVALKTYSSGHSEKGSGSWTPSALVKDALDRACYMAFDAIEPTNKRWMIGVDVSGSMNSAISGMSLTCREAATAMAVVTAATEPWTLVTAFSRGLTKLDFTRGTKFRDAAKITDGMTFETTDCSLPISYALDNNIPVDAFMVLTDNETYAGRIHPFVALKKYREKTGIPAKMIVVGMTSTQFSIADPSDGGMLDVVGLDTATPSVVSDFVRN